VLKDTVTPGAYVEVSVKYGLITLIRETLDLCDHVKEVELKCPIEKGKLTLTKVVKIPQQIPPVSFPPSIPYRVCPLFSVPLANDKYLRGNTPSELMHGSPMMRT